jgi:transposase
MNNNTKSILGIDIAKYKFDTTLRVDQRIFRQQFTNDPAGFAALLKWLRQHQVDQLHAGLESTGRYGLALAHLLHGRGFRVSLLNPLSLHHYARSKFQRHKQDKLDADLMAEYLQKENPPAWVPMTVHQTQLQELSRLLQVRKEQLAQENNRLENLPQSPAAARVIKGFIRILERQITKLHQQLLDSLKSDPQAWADWKLLLSIPGIGELTAAILLAELPRYLQSARAAAAYTGVTPARHQSGTLDYSKGLSVLGNRRLRKALYFPAITALRGHNQLIAAKAQRLRAKGKTEMCIVGAAMHQLVRQAWGVLKHQKPFDPNWQPPQLIPAPTPR